jgi:DNA-binding GntR family transcriptional regulator
MARQPARYEQITDGLHRIIKSGDFTADNALPTESELQGRYQASRNTVREAAKLLVHQHLLETMLG